MSKDKHKYIADRHEYIAEAHQAMQNQIKNRLLNPSFEEAVSWVQETSDRLQNRFGLEGFCRADWYSTERGNKCVWQNHFCMKNKNTGIVLDIFVHVNAAMSSHIVTYETPAQAVIVIKLAREKCDNWRVVTLNAYLPDKPDVEEIFRSLNKEMLKEI